MPDDLTPLISKLLAREDQARITSDQIKERFDSEDPSAYGLQMPKWFPDYDYVHGLLGDILKPILFQEARSLDLGGGTGRVAKLLLEAYPQWQHSTTRAGPTPYKGNSMTSNFVGLWRPPFGRTAHSRCGNTCGS